MARGWVVLLAVGCGPQVEARVECESGEPTKLAVLRGEPEALGSWVVVKRDERGWLASVDGEAWAIECGETPRVFGEGMEAVLFDVEGGDFPWFSAVRDGDDEWPVAVDPWGGREPVRLSGWPSAVDGDAMIVANDGDVPSLARVSFADPWAVTETPIAHELDVLAWHGPYFAARLSSRLFATIDDPDAPGDRVVELDFATGETLELGRGVETVNVRDAGRFVVLIPANAEEPATILDRETGRSTTIGGPGWSVQPLPYDSTLVRAYVYADEKSPPVRTQLVFLPSLASLELEGEWDIPFGNVADDDRRLFLGPDGLYVIAPGDAAPTFLYPGRGWSCVHEGAAYLWDWGIEPPEFGTWDPWLHVVGIPLEGGTAEIVLDGPLSWTLPLSDGRWAIVREIDDEGRGDLLLHDPRSGEEELLARDVDALRDYNARASALPGECMSATAIDAPFDEMVYVAPDDEGRIGTALMRKVEERARVLGAGELAVDTAEPARRLAAT